MKCRVVSGRAGFWHSQAKRCAMYLSVLILTFAATVVAQESVQDPLTDVMQHAPDEPKPDEPDPRNDPDTPKPSSRRGSFVIAPIPISSPAIGTGGTILGAYIFSVRKNDTISPPSVIASAWAGTENGTRAWAAATELYFHQDRYHIVAGVAHGDLNYDFYGTGTAAGDAGQKFGLHHTADAFSGEVLRRTFWQVFVGPRVWFATTRLEPQRAGEANPELPPLGADLSMRSLGFKIERDTRPNRFYPESGTLVEFGSDFFAKALGGTYTFQRYRLTLNSYYSFGDRQVLAYNLFGCSTGGDSPFFGECIFGMQEELRGYTAGRYIDKKMLASQVEYRRSLPLRLGVVVFAGLGQVGPNFSSFDAENILPSAGLGPRVLLSSKYHVNLRADFAWGKNGHTFSMGLGESF